MAELTASPLNSISSTSNASTYASTSFAAGAAGRAVFMWVAAAETSGTVPTPFITGHSDLPFELIGASVGSNPLTDGTSLLALYGCLATGTASDTYTVDFGGNSQAGCLTSVFEVTGFDSTPAVIGDAVAQLETATFTSDVTATVTLEAFADTDDVYLLAIGVPLPATENIVPEADAAELHDLGIGSPNRSLFTSYKANDTSATATWTNSAAGQAGAAVVNSTGVVSGTDDFIVHNQFYNESGSGTALAFTPSVTPTTGNTLVVCVSIEHFQATTYTPGNGYALMTDPDVSTMSYEIGNDANDRQLWYSKVADGDDNFELTAGSGTGGWNLHYWELDGEFEIAKVVSTYNSATVRTLDPSAIADPGNDDIVYTIGWSAVHFEGAADPVTFTGIGTGALIDRGDIASTGGTKCQTSAADRSWNNGNILNQNVVISNHAVDGPRNTCVAWVPVGGGGITVNPSGLAIPLAFGAPTLSFHPIVTPSALVIPIALGAPTLNFHPIVTPSGLAIPIAFGAPTLEFAGAGITVNPASLLIPITFGTPELRFQVAPAGLVIPITFGTPELRFQVAPSGLAIPIVFGSPGLRFQVAPSSLVIPISFGVPTLDFAGPTVNPASLVIPISFGSPGLTFSVAPASLLIPITFGQPSVQGLDVLVAIIARQPARFYRNTIVPRRLVLVPTGHSQRVGFPPGDAWEPVSSPFVMNQGTSTVVMALMSTLWPAQEAADQATLTGLINQRLQESGYRNGAGGALA
jgi:hypothetical protein